MQKQLVAAVAGVLFSSAALAGDFFDTRLSFVFGDNNVLAGAGETTPNSPNARFGASEANTQFYDNFNSRFSGFESLSHVVLYKRAPAFFEGLVTEAALSMLVLEQVNTSGVRAGTIGLQDDSSYIRLTYTPRGWGANENVSFTGFPVSADRFRLGYAYRITWGGSAAFTRLSDKWGVPGAKLQVTTDTWYAFVGGKTALLLNNLRQEEETNYGILGGAGIDVTPELRIEANGGYFQKGIVPSLALQGVNAPVNAAGVSGHVVWHVGQPIGTSVDLTLYRNDPESTQRFFRPERYEGGLSYTVELEGSSLIQTLEDPDVFARTEPQWAFAGALQARVKYNYLRAHLISLYRTFSYIQFDVPSFPPYKTLPDNTELRPEIFAAVGVDYHFPRWHFTPGVILGVQLPAAFRSPSSVLGGNNPPLGVAGPRWVVTRAANDFSILGSGADDVPLPILSAKATFRWDLSEYVAAVGEVYYTRDANRTRFQDDLTGVAEPVYEKEDALGFNTILQARF